MGCQVRWRGLCEMGILGRERWELERGRGVGWLVGDDPEGAELAIGPEEEMGRRRRTRGGRTYPSRELG